MRALLCFCLFFVLMACNKNGADSAEPYNTRLYLCHMAQGLDSAQLANALVGRWSLVSEGIPLIQESIYTTTFSADGRLVMHDSGRATGHRWHLVRCDVPDWSIQVVPTVNPFYGGCLVLCGDEMAVRYSHRDGNDYFLRRTP